MHVPYDNDRCEVASLIRALFHLGGKLHRSMGRHADLFVKFAKCCIDSLLATLAPATWQPPARSIAELHKDQLSLRRQRERVRPERTRPANKPARFEQLVDRGQDEAKEAIGSG